MNRKTESAKTTDALAVMDRMVADSLENRQLLERARINAMVAQLIYDARVKARLSQAELAAKVGTKQSVISRLEDADYEGHSLAMLQRIAVVLDQSVEIRFTEKHDVPGRSRTAKRVSAKRKETLLAHHG